LLPSDSAERIGAQLQKLKTYPLLNGARGRAATDLSQLVQVVQRFMAMGMALGKHAQEMEINPLLVDGARMVAVDLLVIPKSESL
jgi:hypothetical protein